MAWNYHLECYNYRCKEPFECPVDDGELRTQVRQAYGKAVAKGWVTANVRPNHEGGAWIFCSQKCLEESKEHEKIDRPRRYRTWLELHGMDPTDLPGCRKRVELLEAKEQEFIVPIIDFLEGK